MNCEKFAEKTCSILGVLLLLLTACTSAPVAPQSAWGDLFVLAQAEQSSAPALLVSSSSIITASWVGADTAGVHHDMRQIDTALTPQVPVVLPLPPVRPYEQSLYPALHGDMHLLWLDADYQATDPLTANETRLFAALITPALTIARGPTLAANGRVLHYAAVAAGDGALWVAWSGGLPAEPTLFLQRIDSEGRPLASVRVAINADYPALVRTDDGTLYLFWITDADVYRARLTDGSLQQITTAPALQAGDRVANFSVGLDRTHTYLFWNIARANGTFETWLTSAAFDAEQWDVPRQLGVTVSGVSLETGFNGGAGVIAWEGALSLAWSAPLMGQFDALPVAVWDGTQLGIVYLRGGTIIGYQAVAPVETLIGAPALTTDRDRHLYLAWSQPTAAGYAELCLTTTRRP